MHRLDQFSHTIFIYAAFVVSLLIKDFISSGLKLVRMKNFSHSLLPEALISLLCSLPQQDREVLLFLMMRFLHANDTSMNFGNSGGGGCGEEHALSMDCRCFQCYMVYWDLWNRSPNSEKIHKAMEMLEDFVAQMDSNKKMKCRDRKLQARQITAWLDRFAKHGRHQQQQNHKALLYDQPRDSESELAQLPASSNPSFRSRVLSRIVPDIFGFLFLSSLDALWMLHGFKFVPFHGSC